MDLYNVLGVSHEQADDLVALKKAYKDTLLRTHPDKVDEETASDTNTTVQIVRRAYEILSDPHQREIYDLALKNSGKIQPVSVSDTVDLGDMVEHEEESCVKWTRACRCGDDEGYTLTEQDLIDNEKAEEIVVQCSGCSIWIKVVYSEA